MYRKVNTVAPMRSGSSLAFVLQDTFRDHAIMLLKPPPGWYISPNGEVHVCDVCPVAFRN